MKPRILQLLLRNAMVALAFMAVFSGLFFLPDAYTPPGLICLAGFLATFLWANGPLFNPLSAIGGEVNAGLRGQVVAAKPAT